MRASCRAELILDLRQTVLLATIVQLANASGESSIQRTTAVSLTFKHCSQVVHITLLLHNLAASGQYPVDSFTLSPQHQLLSQSHWLESFPIILPLRPHNITLQVHNHPALTGGTGCNAKQRQSSLGMCFT